MSKKNWTKIVIGVVILMGTLLLIKTLPFWATILALGSYISGITSYWALKKFDSKMEAKDNI